MKSTSIIKKELVVLTCCVCISGIIHGIYVIDGFPEQDAARLAVQAAEWYQTSTWSMQYYTQHTSPLYLHMLRGFMEIGVPLKSIPGLMNWLNVILGSLTFVPLYFLWRKLANRQVAAVACFIFFFTPAFWLANSYGMPHLPSFSFFLISLILFSHALQHKGKSALICSAASAILAAVSLGFKADMILCFGAFLGVAIYIGNISRRNVFFLLLIPIAAFIILNVYSYIIAKHLLGFSDSAQWWTHRFSKSIGELFNRAHNLSLETGAGKVLFFVSVISIAYCTIWRIHSRAMLLVLLWALPAFIFWGVKGGGNSPRHLMASYSALVFLVAIILNSSMTKKWMQWMIVSIILAMNYWISSPSGAKRSPTSYPTSRLHGLMASVQGFSNYQHELASVFESIPVDKKLYAGSSTVPYVEWEAISNALSFEVARLKPLMYRLEKNDNSRELLCIKIIKATGGQVIGPDDDWLVFSYEKRFQFRNIPRFEKYHNELQKAVLRNQWRLKE